MITRVVFCKGFPSSFAKVAAAVQCSKQLARNATPFCVAPSKLFFDAIPRRFYSEQTNIEAMIVDYEAVRKAASDNNILIIDVREPDEIKEHGKIPNSINIPLGSVTSTLSKMPDTDFQSAFQRKKPSENTEIIFYCMIGKRSGMAQQNAMNLGFKNVKNYLGSWTDWATKGQTK